MFICYVTHEFNTTYFLTTSSITSEHKTPSYLPNIRRFKSIHNANNKNGSNLLRNKARCEECPFLRVSVRTFDGKQTSCYLQQKAIHISAFRLATRLEPFVIFSLVIGRWHDVTVWAFYQTQCYYFRKSFVAIKSWKKTWRRTRLKKELLWLVVDGNLLVRLCGGTPEKVTLLRETLRLGTIPNERKRNYKLWALDHKYSVSQDRVVKHEGWSGNGL